MIPTDGHHDNNTGRDTNVPSARKDIRQRQTTPGQPADGEAGIIENNDMVVR